MAHKKRKAKVHGVRRRSHRVGAIHKADIMNDGAGLVGLVIGSVLATSAQRMATKINPKIVSGVEILGGMFIKHRFHSPLMQGIGWGVAGAGAIGMTHEFGIIHGVDNMCDKIFNPAGVGPGVYAPGPGTQQVMVPNKVGYMSDVSGIRNEDMMSGHDDMGGDDDMGGISNFDLMSGAESSLKQEYDEVQSLGM